jgi:thioredoxin 2
MFDSVFAVSYNRVKSAGWCHMSTDTVPCTFCATLNRVNLERIADKPKCGHCGRPIMLDRPMRLTDDSFDRVIGDASVDVLVDFYADWCAPCKIMAPALDEVAHEQQGHVLVAKLDTDRNPKVAGRFSIRAIPTLIVFRNGAERARQSGAMPRPQIEALLGLHARR